MGNGINVPRHVPPQLDVAPGEVCPALAFKAHHPNDPNALKAALGYFPFIKSLEPTRLVSPTRLFPLVHHS